jgi:chromosome segregation ATPase
MATPDEHFQKYFGIMFTSAHEGEQINALRALRRHAGKQGIHWTDVFSQTGTNRTAGPTPSAELASLRAERDRLARENASLKETLARAQGGAGEVQRLRKQNENLQCQVAEALLQSELLRKQHGELTRQVAQAVKQSDLYEKRNKELQRELETAGQDAETARLETAAVRKQAEHLKADLLEAQAAWEQKENELQAKLDRSFPLSAIETIVGLLKPEPP